MIQAVHASSVVLCPALLSSHVLDTVMHALNTCVLCKLNAAAHAYWVYKLDALTGKTASKTYNSEES